MMFVVAFDESCAPEAGSDEELRCEGGMFCDADQICACPHTASYSTEFQYCINDEGIHMYHFIQFCI